MIFWLLIPFMINASKNTNVLKRKFYPLSIFDIEHSNARNLPSDLGLSSIFEKVFYYKRYTGYLYWQLKFYQIIDEEIN